jgi:CheY-like chemotaxis protein
MALARSGACSDNPPADRHTCVFISRSAPTPIAPMARLLVIDDEPLLRAVVHRALARAGHEVLEAANGLEGYRLFLEHGPFDVVITDLVMPEMSGWEVIRQIRGHETPVKIIAMSGCGLFDSVEDGLRMATGLGADLCFQKPFTTGTLLAAVAGLIGGVPS